MPAMCIRLTWFIKSKDNTKITNDAKIRIKNKYKNKYFMLILLENIKKMFIKHKK